MKKTAYEVPTTVIAEQARRLLQQMTLPENAERILALAEFGIDAPVFSKALAAETTKLEEADATQESAKQEFVALAADDSAEAEAGYRWKLRLDARVRLYIKDNGDKDNLAGRFRFGDLHSARARGVLEALRIVIPEALKYQAKLSKVGVTKKFIEEGQALLTALGGDKKSEPAKSKRGKLTKAVLASELKVSRMIDRLREADETVALDDPAQAPVFRLDIIKAEVNRVKAAREARVEAAGEKGEGGGEK